ncbi:MAG: YjjI family glycine radical enzyme [Acidimicrobiia bacterium]
MELSELQDLARRVVDDPALTYRQRVQALAGVAEEALPPPDVSDDCAAALDKRVICDLHEGNAPYRPRYTLPDYELAMSRGSAFLELPPPQALDEALTFLLCMYGNVPSITGYPVWLGDVDRLLLPFTDGVSDAELHRRLRLHWITLDRLFPDAFTHANIGPTDNRVARTVLALHRELLQIVPNLTLKVDPATTPDDLLLDAVRTVVESAQPHLVNHPMMVADLGERYGVVSCYNSLPVGGGSHTLVRLNLKEVALRHHGASRSFVTDTLPRFVELTAELIEARIRHIVERARFFDHSWLAREGLLSLDRFTAMFGLFGLAECVELLLEADGVTARYGHDAIANELSYAIVSAVSEQVAAREMPYCEGFGGRCILHSQAGIETDIGATAGSRVPVGQEPELYRHLRAVAPHHVLFPSGVSDIVHLDDTVADNPQAAVDIAKGAFALGMRDVTFNTATNGFIRITGYLVRKSDLEHVAEGVRHASTALGAGSVQNMHVDARRVQRVRSHELDPRPAR